MPKKLMAYLIPLVVALSLVPAIASANDPQLTENGTLVPTLATVNATNNGSVSFVTTSGTTQVTCTKVRLEGQLENNGSGGGGVEIKFYSPMLSGTGAVNSHNGLNECTGSFGNAYVTFANWPLLLKSTLTMADDEFQITGFGANLRFIIGSTTAGACEYEATSSVKGDLTTGNTTLLTVRSTQAGSGSKLIKGGFLCPSSGMLKMSLYLETENAELTELGVS